MGKFGEPWTVEKKHKSPGLFDCDGNLIADAAIGSAYEELYEDIKPEHLGRIMACVNACEDVDAPVRAELAAVQEKNRVLLAACRQVLGEIQGDYVAEVWGRDLKYLEDAIKQSS